ncbi:MAG TPA: DUF4388 domain-containing protein [Polyangiaceae bacterium]
MSAERRGPLSFLDTEWRTALWKRWVSAYLVTETNGVTKAASGVAPPAAATPSAAADSLEPSATHASAEYAARPETPAPSPKRAHAVQDDTRRNERRADVRARFDALSERLQGLEDAIDVIARRMSHRSRRERRTDRRTAELVENIAESVEAHAVALDSLGTAIERIERRLERAEGERRDSRIPKARSSEPPRSVQPPRLDDTGDFSAVREGSDEDDASTSGSSIRGSIGELSLSTVLAMLEIERRSGRLKVQGEDGSLVAFELEDGSVVGSRVSENDMDAVESLREVLTWKNGRFWFRQNPSESLISPPRSVNSLLLEATRQIDEAVRFG